MLVSYDFDIRWIIPRDLEADPAIGKMLGDIGFNMDARGNYVAVFRDPAVVALVERADPVLRDYLKASGFGFVASGSGVPAGFYPAEDEGALTDVVQRLKDNLAKFPMQDAELGGFDFAAFLKAIAAAQPLAAGAGPRRRPRVEPTPSATPPSANPSDCEGSDLALRSRFNTLLVNLLGLMLVFYIAVKLFAAPSGF